MKFEQGRVTIRRGDNLRNKRFENCTVVLEIEGGPRVDDLTSVLLEMECTLGNTTIQNCSITTAGEIARSVAAAAMKKARRVPVAPALPVSETGWRALLSKVMPK